MANSFGELLRHVKCAAILPLATGAEKSMAAMEAHDWELAVTVAVVASVIAVVIVATVSLPAFVAGFFRRSTHTRLSEPRVRTRVPAHVQAVLMVTQLNRTLIDQGPDSRIQKASICRSARMRAR